MSCLYSPLEIVMYDCKQIVKVMYLLNEEVILFELKMQL